jgi:hypothetical protein
MSLKRKITYKQFKYKQLINFIINNYKKLIIICLLFIRYNQLIEYINNNYKPKKNKLSFI